MSNVTRTSCCCSICLTIFLTFVCSVFGQSSQPPRPNIILIMCDDMGWSDLGCYGGEIDSPNIDRMASEGLRFTQFYNNAKCTTTRASILTGLFPRPKNGLLKTNMVTLGEVMQDAGYRTGLFGKWHLGRSETTHPVHRGFDEFYGLLDGACNFFDPSIRDPEYKGSRTRYFAHNLQRVEEFSPDFYTTDAFTEQAIAFIRQSTNDRQPYFLHLCYTAPHYPLHAKPEDIAKYRGRFRHGWEAMRRARIDRQLEMGLIDASWQLSDTDSRAYDWDSSDQEFEDLRMAVYAAMIDCMDQNIGKLLETLEDLEIADNTLVMFLSDNGGCAEEPGGRNPQQRRPGPKDDYVAVGPSWGWAQNAPFRRYKSWLQEGGICTPLIVRYPGVVEPGGITNQVGHIIDIMPTCLELAGGEYPKVHNGQGILPLNGRSLVPILLGKQRVPHSQLCWEWSGNAAIRRGNWKLVWDKLTKNWELFDLQTDRTETNDLAAAHPGRVAQLAAAYDRWATQTGNKRIVRWFDLFAKSSLEGWTNAQNATLDPTNRRALVAKPGNGVLISSLRGRADSRNLTTRKLFGDLEVHVEFLLTEHSNAGVKLQGLYEIQLRDTHGKRNLTGDDCGGIYPRAEKKPSYHTIDEGVPPRMNAAKPAGHWQTLDIVFRAPRFNDRGDKVANARFVKVELNDKLIHENIDLEYPTGAAWRMEKEVAVGPLYLQGDHGPVAYRNVRIRAKVSGTNGTVGWCD